jgi:predicted deacylase
MAKEIKLGTATAQPGSIQYGQWDAIIHPTGHRDFLPVIIAQGKQDGPCIWLTAGIHGPEHAGPSVLYRLITQELVSQLRGTIVALPALSPAGLRTREYVPYHLPKNPNRLWPDGKPAKPLDPDIDAPSSVETAFGRLFDSMLETADYLIDYHNSSIDSISFAFRDRVLYRADQNSEENKSAAEALAVRQGEMLRAYGHTIVTEFPAKFYIKQDLHRSTSGAALLLGHIPGFTVELGTGLMPDPAIVAASVVGTRNVLRWAGMLGGEMEQITGIKMVDPGYRTRRRRIPRVDEACVVLHLVEAGDLVKEGDPVAELRDTWGRPLGDGLLRAKHEGFVIGRAHGIYFYPGQPVLYISVRDEDPLVAPYPDDYFDD